MLTYDFLAGFLILIVGVAIIVDRALANYDSRPFGDDDQYAVNEDRRTPEQIYREASE